MRIYTIKKYLDFTGNHKTRSSWYSNKLCLQVEFNIDSIKFMRHRFKSKLKGWWMRLQTHVDNISANAWYLMLMKMSLKALYSTSAQKWYFNRLFILMRRFIFAVRLISIYHLLKYTFLSTDKMIRLSILFSMSLYLKISRSNPSEVVQESKIQR